MKKQVFLFGLGTSLLFQSVAMPVYATETNISSENDTQEEVTTVEVENPHIIQSGSFNPIVSELNACATEAFSLTPTQESEIVSAMFNREESINVSSYQIPYDKTVITQVIADIVNNHPELYFVDNTFSYSSVDTDYVTAITPSYIDGLGYAADKAEFETAVNKAIAQTEGLTSDFEKALVLHDYLVLQCEYKNTGDTICHSAYGALVNRTPVCQGYALAYKYLLNKVGIECYYVSSSSMNHGWNMVKLDGNYYHVDVTWDDPTSDQFGYAQHNYFLLSDDTMENQESKHYDWVVSEGGSALDLTATSTVYESYAWKGIRSAIIPYEGNWYYADYTKSAIIKNSNLASENTETEFYSLNSYWNGYLDSLMLYEDYFFFPASDGIYKLSAKDTSVCEQLIEGASITGCVLDEDVLKYKQNGNVQTYSLTDESSGIDGDKDTDASIPNITDVVVPTDLSLAFNPNGLPVVKKDGITSNDQVVSLSYGIIQRSSQDKKITLSFSVEDENNKIKFVTNKEAVDSAADGTYVAYVEAIPGTSIKVDNSNPTKDTTSDKLNDIEMSEDTSHAIGANGGALAFIMDKATYVTDESGETDINDLILSELGSECSNVGFTFGGSMNTNTDWTKLDKGIKVSVTYKIEDVSGTTPTYGLVTN